MGGVGRLGTPSLLAHFQVVLLDDVIEAVVAHAVFRAELTLVHVPEFSATDTPVLLADAMDELYDKRLICKLPHLTVAMLVVGLGGHTKQLTLRRNGVCLHVASVKPTDYLVPAFFKSMPYTSLPKATISS